MTDRNDASQDDPATLGGLIRSERERQGLSLRQLGALIGVDASAILLWERDETMPKAKHLAGLSRALEIPAHQLVSLSGADLPIDASMLPAMLRAEFDLPPEAIADVERYIARTVRKYGATTNTTTHNEGRNP